MTASCGYSILSTFRQKGAEHNVRDAPSYIVLIMTDALLNTKHSKERAGDTHE